mmetsp:Transcript_9106/g.17401  ORF Transcript_9106/g.17401 Transcript_9106/m.17401 type:complete len:202 (-) Transcript_9106:189-794(-)
MSGKPGYSPQPGLSQPSNSAYPRRLFPQPFLFGGCCGRKCSDLPESNGRGAACLSSLRCLTGVHEQLDLWGWFVWVLRDYSRRRRGRPKLAWAIRRAHAHDQHSYHRPRNNGEKVPCIGEAVQPSARVWRSWPVQGRGRGGSRLGVLAPSVCRHPQRAKGFASVGFKWRRGRSPGQESHHHQARRETDQHRREEHVPCACW